MIATGIVRRVDELGRIVIPIELRRTLGIAERDALEIFTDSDRIVLQKYVADSRCVFCGRQAEGVIFKGKCICKECLATIKDDGT